MLSLFLMKYRLKTACYFKVAVRVPQLYDFKVFLVVEMNSINLF